MFFKSSCFAILSTTIFILSGCSTENKQISQTYRKISQTETLAVPQAEVVETAKFKELRRQFEGTENEVKQIDNLRNSLRTMYTDEYPKVKKVSRDLAKTKQKLKIIEELLNSEREKLEYRLKNSPV